MTILKTVHREDAQVVGRIIDGKATPIAPEPTILIFLVEYQGEINSIYFDSLQKRWFIGTLPISIREVKDWFKTNKK